MNFISELNSRILISDGAMGSFLLGKAKCPEELNLNNPDLVESITENYVEAGADLVQTNTFGANPIKLSDYGLSEASIEINKKAVEIAKKASKGRAFVYASCGPTGRLMVPFGDTKESEIEEAYKIQINALLEANVDAISIETMTDLREALIALKIVRSISASIPVFVSMTFNKTNRGYFTIMGNSIEDCVKELKEATVIGSNCGNGFKEMLEIANEFRKFYDGHLIIQPNAGIPYYRNNMLIYPETPEYFASLLRDLLKFKVSIIGGCCGTTQEHIKAIKEVVSLNEGLVS